MTPGRYLALRRLAAGLSRADVESLAGLLPGHMESLEEGAGGWTVGKMIDPATAYDQLAGAFPLCPIVLRRLATRERVSVCLGCGCSELDACDDEEYGPCSWFGPAHCTDCERKGVLPE